MPRKRSVLPRPCPLCGRTDGTYQFVVFNNKNITSRHAVICRIGHYDKNYYLKRQFEILSNNIREKKAEPVTHLPPQLEKMLFPPSNILKTKKPCGKVWHCFKVDSSFLWIPGDEKEVSLSEYFDAFKEDEGWRTSYTVSPTQKISELIKKEGWRIGKSYYMARRKIKEYTFPSLLTREDLLTDGEKEWFAKRKKYSMPPSC